MDVYSLRARILKALAVVLLTSGFSYGAIIFDSGIASLTASDPTQLGRLSRNGVVSDWSASKVFPGVVNPTTTYFYAAYTVPITFYSFIQISFDDVAGTALTFASAYLNSYQPVNLPPNNGLNINYLGDPGSSGNSFGVNPLAFQVQVAPSNDLIVVVTDTSPTGAGVGQNYHIIVEGFTDTNFSDAVPEPATLALSFAGLGVMILVARRRLKVQRG